MPRALVVFNPSSQQTRLAAEEIARGICGAGRVTAVVTSLAELSPAKVEGFDIIVLGSPASSRAAIREAHDLSAALPTGALDHKTVSVFDAGPNASHGAGARTLRDSLREVDPSLHLASPGISVVVDRGSGELPEEERARCRQFGEHLAGVAGAAGLA